MSRRRVGFLLAQSGTAGQNRGMEELVRTNDIVLISVVESLLDGAGIRYIVLDNHMSVLEGSIGMIARRILVDSDEIVQARRLLTDAGLGAELRLP